MVRNPAVQKYVRGASALLALSALAVGVFYAATRSTESSASSDAVETTEESADSAAMLATRRPNILLFSIDTLRADHLHSYGYARDTSPTMDALAARGTRFARAYSTASWTLPSVVSLLTGVLPSEHGVIHHEPRPDGTIEQDFLGSDLPSLPTLLQDAGYRTIGVTANAHLRTEGGFSRGFDDYLCMDMADAEGMRAEIWSRLDALREGDRPYFLWVHVTDPHVRYRARSPQFERWWGESRPRHAELEQSLFLVGIQPVAATNGLPVPEAIEYVDAAYDSEIRAVDDFLSDLLAALDDEQLAVVVTADHGEELNDHGWMGHGMTLFEETVHVPLIVTIPGVAPSVVTTPVQLIDVMPTLADLSGSGPTDAAGCSLVAAMQGSPLAPRDLLLESGRAVPIAGVVNERYKYGEVLAQPQIHRLFDLSVDPTEQNDISAREPALATELHDRVLAQIDAARARRRVEVVEQVAIPPVVVDQLRALGYAN